MKTSKTRRAPTVETRAAKGKPTTKPITKAKPTTKAKPATKASPAAKGMKGKPAKKTTTSSRLGKAVFVLTKMPGCAFLQLKREGSHDWILGAKVGSLKKGSALVDAIKARCGLREHYDLTQVKAAHNPHWYFTLRGADGAKLGGLGGFATEADAEAGIALVARTARGAVLAV